MPEIKNTFIQGKMNKDLDERLIPNGQYRHALNVEVSTSEGSDVGTVKNILGNQRAENLVGSDFTCVGSIADEKNNKLYWFISKYDVDAILEYDADNDIAQYVLVDIYAGTEKAVLKFFGNVITGINIIDNLLFWTDNQGEPKKINIDTCKAGTTVIGNQTQLSFKNGSFNGMTVGLTSRYGNFTAPSIHPVDRQKYVWFEMKKFEAVLGENFDDFRDLTTGDVDIYRTIRHYRDGEFLGQEYIRIFDSPNGTHFRTSPGRSGVFRVGDVIFADNIKTDIKEKHITVIRPKPLNAFAVKINHTDSFQNTSKIPNLFETKFPRFSYRYKYADGEYSTFAPFTEPVFNAKYTKDTSKSIDGGVMYNQNTAYDIKEPYNKAMVNAIHSVELSNFITAQTPEDVVEVEVLYKQENSSVIYSIQTISHVDKEWHFSSNHEGLGLDIGVGKASSSNGSYKAEGSLTGGKYIVTTENIYAALPANQLLRPWDNVPRKALAQEVTGNRIVYANYLQNYNIGSKPQVQVSYGNRQNRLGSFDSKGLPSIKSQRNYQLGVVYCDKYGRETPVFTSNNGAVSIPWQDSSGKKNASKSTQLTVGAVNNFPEWVDSLKFFVKETSNEYYNLTMERAWVTKSTYALDNSEGHLWISFPSSDRNKISEEDYIILKKKIGVGEEQVTFENKFRVIDIKNEAPDAIKYDLVNQGVAQNKTNSTSQNFFTAGTGRLFVNGEYRIDKEVDSIHIEHDSWKGAPSNHPGTGYRTPLEDVDSGVDTDEMPLKTKDLYMSWRVEDDGNGNEQTSSRYKIVGGSKFSSAYILNLERKITAEDAALAANGTSLKTDLLFQVEKRVLKEEENFSGKFFVKISKNQVSSIIETGKEVSNLDKYQVTARQGVWHWHDDIQGATGSPIVGHNKYGLTNNFGFDAGHEDDITSSNINHIHRSYTDSNGNNNTSADTTYSPANKLRISDWWEVWNGIRNELDNKPRFFIDSMHMIAGQSEASDYAKYSCVTWSGCTTGDDLSAESSAWSYPPLKTWLSEFGDTSNLLIPEREVISFGGVQVIPSTSAWYENNLISTSPLLNTNIDYEDLPIDGWVGPLQNVSRQWDKAFTNNGLNHINGLEGLVTTNEFHATGPRRWFSGLNGTDYGVGDDTKTYSDNGEEDRHFMHLSFFAPGKDLHDGVWTYGAGLGGVTSIGRALYSETGFMAHLQGIWGGGVFTGEDPNQTFGATGDHVHLAMEGNYDDAVNYLPEPPGPGVGFGYDLDYRELHERQWDPTFLHDSAGTLVGDPGNKIRDFIRNLYPGSKFRFHHTKPGVASTNVELDDEVYTIKKVVIKKLYNHTSWRKPYNRYIDGEGYDIVTTQNIAYRSVEEVALDYLNQLNSTGNSTGGSSYVNNFKDKIEQFGASHNRRLCYIIELDKNPRFTTSVMGNPLDTNSNGHDAMSGDLDSDNFTDVEFLDPVQDLLLSDLSKFPAIWEIDPKKQDVDLDIYYEASNNIPVRINEKTNELFAPVGCKVEIIDATPQQELNDVYLESWDGNTATFYPGFNRADGNNEIDYTNTFFKFIREDGSYTVAEAGGQQLIGELAGIKSDFIFKEDVGSVIGAGLAWYNCFSFGNGLESNRIRDDFNEMFIANGVKASTTTQQTYEEERRSHGLIYSGIYNSNSGVNDLNQFIMAEKITKDLNPTYGTIQKLFQRRISLIAFCEDRVVQIISNKDAIFNADGSSQLISSSNVLGDANPFVGNFGISKNPESFASQSYRAYFTDKARGAVLRLSKDGLTPISKAGMHDWFRDNLPMYTSLIGTYDSYKENYNITLSNTYTENIIFNEALGQGVSSNAIKSTLLNIIENGVVNSGDSYRLTYNDPGFEASFLSTSITGDYHFGNADSVFKNTVTVTNHPAIGSNEFQVSNIVDNPNIAVENPFGTGGAQESQPFQQAIYDLTPGTDDGWWYDPRFKDSANSAIDLFGPSAYNYADAEVYSVIKRHVNGFDINENSPGSDLPVNSTGATFNWDVGYDPSVEKAIGSYPYYSGNYSTGNSRISKAITRTAFTTVNAFPVTLGNLGAILFDRPNPGSSYVEFKNIGNNSPDDADHPSLFNYNNASGTPGDADHSSFFNGDEIHIQVNIACYVTLDGPGGIGVGSNNWYYGYNYIEPEIQLFNGTTPLDSLGVLKSYDNFGVSFGGFQASQIANGGVYDPYAYQQTIVDNMGSDFKNATSLNVGGVPTFYNSSDDAIGYAAHSSGVAVFPNTSTITSLTASASNGAGQVVVTIGASFKFIDPNQQNPNGTPLVFGADIEEVKVVDDLRIRIRNSVQGSASDYGYSVGVRGMNNPLWEISSVKVKKGFGVIAPHVDFEPEIITFDDILTGGIQSYTVADLIADPNAQLNPSGQWVLNQGTITTQQNVSTGSQPAIPGYDIPAWVEVNHSSIAPWTFNNNVGAGSGYNNSGTEEKITAKTVGWFGDNNIGTTVNATGIDGTVYNWRLPPGFNTTTGLDSQPSTKQTWPFNDTGLTLGGNNFTAQGQGTLGLNDGGGTHSPEEKDYVDVVSDYWKIDQSNNSPNSSYSIHCPLGTGEEYVVGDWYFIDIEYADNEFDNDNKDELNKPDIGNRLGTATNNDGTVFVPGVADGTLFSSGLSSGDVIDGNGVGLLVGGPSSAHVALVPTYRTEYSDDRWVLRAIYQVHTDSDVASNHLDYFSLRFYNFKNHTLYVSKIISKKINYVNGTGIATNWDIDLGNSTYDQLHTFSDGIYNTSTDDYSNVYFYNKKLCWDNAYGNEDWSQNFQNIIPTTADTTPAQDPNWTLKFTVGPNPITGLAIGELAVAVSNSIGDSVNSGQFDGMIVKGLDVDLIGSYEITFGMNGADDGDASWDIVHSSSPNVPYTSYSVFSWYDNLATATSSTFAEMIRFFNANPANSLSCNVSGVTLTNQVQLFQGGTVASWNFDGFEPTIDDYIIWDGSTSTDGRIQFQNCPMFDLNSTGVTEVITANQLIDKPINRYENYEISFTYKMANTVDDPGAGLLHMYYFNSKGYGFRIQDIGDPSNPAIASNSTGIYLPSNIEDIGGGVRKVTIVVEIGSSEASSELLDQGVEALLNTFVIRKDDSDLDSVTGWIDNVSMKRSYNIEMTPEPNSVPIYPETTVTYSEDVNGWISFKSFLPEAGLSLSKKYFTIKDAMLYQHYVPLSLIAAGATPETAENYNTFYGTHYPSTIKAVLNAEPSVIKTFNTLNYEGSQAYVTKPLTALDVFGNSAITINNVKAWSNGSDVEGWNATEIKTDMDNGNLQNFIKKEGKWFGYIKGKHIIEGDLDTSLFSVEGIGFASSITGGGGLGPGSLLPTGPLGFGDLLTPDTAGDTVPTDPLGSGGLVTY